MNVRLCHWFSHTENWIYCNLNSGRSEKHTSGYNNLSHKSHTTKQCHWTFGLVGNEISLVHFDLFVICGIHSSADLDDTKATFPGPHFSTEEISRDQTEIFLCPLVAFERGTFKDHGDCKYGHHGHRPSWKREVPRACRRDVPVVYELWGQHC